jgi:ferredoxin
MKLDIDAKRCMGHARCYAMAPDLLTEDEEGFVAERGQVLDVPVGLEGQAEEAASACPESALAILRQQSGAG